MTNEPENTGYRSETTRGRAEAMNPGPGNPLSTGEDERQREVAETVNPGPNTDDLGMDERGQQRAHDVNPASHTDLSEGGMDSGVAERMNLGPQD